MKLNIIITSTRPGRAGVHVGRWFHDHARANDQGFDIQLTDLAELDLPLFNEPNHPAQQKYEHAHTKNWSGIIDKSDAFVFVLPEYNFTAPPSFVNAVTYLFKEWQYKPAGLVSYGGISGGLRSSQTAKLLLSSLKVVPLVEQVVLPAFSTQISKDGFEATERNGKAADSMLAELWRWSEALRTLR